MARMLLKLLKYAAVFIAGCAATLEFLSFLIVKFDGTGAFRDMIYEMTGNAIYGRPGCLRYERWYRNRRKRRYVDECS